MVPAIVEGMDQIGIGRHGAITRRAAIAQAGGYEVRRAQESGRWLSPWSGVLVEARRAGEPLTMTAAAVELGGPDVVVAGPTAAFLHGCRAVPPFPVHLVAPYGHWLRSRPGLTVHNGPLPDADRERVQDLPVLGLPRTVTDLLCVARPTDALAVLDEVLAMLEPARRGPFRAEIAGRLAERRDPRGTRRGAQLLGLATGRAASPAESWALCRIVDAGFPVPEVNWPLIGVEGFQVWELDLAWPDLRIVVEYDGYAAHAGREAKDEARAKDLRRRGWIVVRMYVDDHGSLSRWERELDDAFRSRGVDMSRRCAGRLQGRRHREPRSA